MEESLESCTRCLVPKPESEYGWTGRGKVYKRHQCKACVRELQRAYGKKITTERLEYSRRPDVAEKSRERARQYYARNRETCKEKAQKHRAKPETKKRKYARHKERRRTDPQYRMKVALHHRMTMALNGARKQGRLCELMGCTVEHLMTHLESLFQQGMTWQNHGAYRLGEEMKWHIDHITPCLAYDLTNESEQRLCFHWTNLQPLWAVDNIRKSDWVPDYQI